MIDKSLYTVDPTLYEDFCIAIPNRSAYLFCYPYVREVWITGAKVVTRSGRTARSITEEAGGRLLGYVDGVQHEWDLAGRAVSPYKDSPLDLYIPEKYFRKDWPDLIKMSNADYQLKYGIEHPKAKIQKKEIVL